MSDAEHEWLWGWDETPGIVSVWADASGRAWVFRRSERGLVQEEARFRPWMLLASLEDLEHLGPRLRHVREPRAAEAVTWEELDGPGALRFLVEATDGQRLARALTYGASRRLGRRVGQVRELGRDRVLVLAPEEQYLVQSGRSYFRDLPFDALRRLQLDLETTGLDPERARIFLVALRTPDGEVELLESEAPDDAGEARLIESLVRRIRLHDPDLIENHNLHGFDLPFLVRRATILGVPLALGRAGPPGVRTRPAMRGARLVESDGPARAWTRMRFTIVGRETIDTLDAVRRHDFSARDLPGHGLKAVARHFGLASPEREQIPGALVHATYLRDPERVRRYAREDVHEAAALARLLGGATYALAHMVPRRYERLADAGAATGVIDPLLVRAYLRAKRALPAHQESDGTVHSGAALHLFATGVAERIVKADVASLYPSLIRVYQIGPARDRLGVFLTLVDRLVALRLDAKARARTAPRGSPERFADEALSAAMKIVVNSAYGYLGAARLTRFSDVHAANEVTRRGRELLALLCRALAERGVTLLEADTDGVYFAVPASFSESDEQRVVAEVAALLPDKVRLELEGRYAAMLSHEPKNYALLGYDGVLALRGVAFRSRRAEPFGERFLRRALAHLLRGDVPGVREAYVETCMQLRQRTLPTRDVATLVRLSKTPEEYRAQREVRRELPYEALLASGRRAWSIGVRVRVYRAQGGRAALLPESEEEGEEDSTPGPEAPRDYDVDYYLRVLRESFATRLSRALAPEHYAAVLADPEQLALFVPSLVDARPILTVLTTPALSPGDLTAEPRSRR